MTTCTACGRSYGNNVVVSGITVSVIVDGHARDIRSTPTPDKFCLECSMKLIGGDAFDRVRMIAFSTRVTG